MAYTEFFATKGASASDLNGGGPRLGTNDAPIETGTATVTAGSLTLIVLDVGNWASAQADDFLCWDTAGVKEMRRIVSVVTNTITVDRACTAGAAKTCNVAGAWSTIQFAVDTLDRATIDFRNAAGEQIRLNIKTGTYDEQVNFDTNAGLVTDYILVQGYGTTPGDGTRPSCTITGAGASKFTFKFTGDRYYHLKDLNITNAADSLYLPMWVNASKYNIFENLQITETGAVACVWTATYDLFVNCTLIHTGVGAGYCWNSSGVNLLVGCELSGGKHATGGNGLAALADVFVNCVFRDSADGSGLSATGVIPHFVNCLFDGNTDHGLLVTGGLTGAIGCGFTNNGLFGISTTKAVAGRNNGFYNNTSGTTSGAYYSQNDQTTDPLFTNRAAKDFSLEAASPWKAAGWPGAILSALWTGYLDIGPVQRQEPVGGGSRNVIL